MMRGNQRLSWSLAVQLRSVEVLPARGMCVLVLRWAPGVAEELWTDVGDTAGLISEGTRCWNCSPHSELQKVMRFMLQHKNTKWDKEQSREISREVLIISREGIIARALKWELSLILNSKSVAKMWSFTILLKLWSQNLLDFTRPCLLIDNLHKKLLQSRSVLGIKQIKGWAWL